MPPFSLEDVENLYYYEDADGNLYSVTQKDRQLETWTEELEEAEALLEDEPDNAAILSRISALENNIESLEDAEPRMQEIYEWWIVSGFLAKKLENMGSPSMMDKTIIGGRCATGQAILVDWVIGKICYDLEILHGIKGAWS